MICTSCCGLKRGNELPCPPSCTYFPFGLQAYDLFLKVNVSFTPKALEYTVKRAGRSRFRKVLERMDIGERDPESSIEISVPAAMLYFLSFYRDAGGKTVADRWEEEGWAGLNNDERFMAKYRRFSFPTIVEVRKVLSGHTMECADALDPEGVPFVMFDRSIAWGTDRFSRYFIWVTRYPHFCRPEGGGLSVPYTVHDDFVKAIKKRAGKGDARRVYLAERFGELSTLLRTMITGYTEKMIKSMDLINGIAEYAVTGSREAIREILREKPDFDPDERDPKPGDPAGAEYYVWLRRGESKEIEKEMISYFSHEDEDQGIGAIGTLKLTLDRLVIDVFGGPKYEFAKEMVEKYFGREVTFHGETVKDLSQEMTARLLERSEWASARPEEEREHIPRDVEQQLLEKFYLDHYTKFLGEPVPALKGRTPREAAVDPKMRPLLVELMKSHLRQFSEMCRKKGFEMSIDWVLEELGLRELL
jgi:hypothetical protein